MPDLLLSIPDLGGLCRVAAPLPTARLASARSSATRSTQAALRTVEQLSGLLPGAALPCG